MPELPVIAVDRPVSGSGLSRLRLGPVPAIVAVLAVIFVIVLNVFRREAYSGDEGFYGVAARNMLADPARILAPSYLPGGNFAAEKDAFAHPPFNSQLYALSLWLSGGSLAGPELLHAAALALLMLCAWRMLREWDRRAAEMCVVLLAASPTVTMYYSQLEPEPLMVTFGIAAWCLACRTRVPDSMPQFFVIGLLLGFAFLAKLWLAAPFFLAVGVCIVLGAKRRWPALLVCAGAAALPAGLHLIAVACFDPEHAGFWWSQIYLGVFTQSGLAGSKLAGNGVPAQWQHPFWYYPAVIYRDHFFLVPILFFGLPGVLRRWRRNRLLVASACAGVAGAIPLSLMRIKEPLYVLPSAIFLYFLAGVCLAAILNLEQAEDRRWRQWATGLTLALMAGVLAAFALQIEPEQLTRPFVAGHTLALSLLLLLVRARQARPAIDLRTAFCAAGFAVIVAMSVYQFVTRSPRDEAIAALVRPHLAQSPPAHLSFVASNFKSYQFHTFRRGVYWKELPLGESPEKVLATARFAQVRAFIIDPEDQKHAANQTWIEWLEKNAIDKTRELKARLRKESGYRVYVLDRGRRAET